MTSEDSVVIQTLIRYVGALFVVAWLIIGARRRSVATPVGQIDLAACAHYGTQLVADGCEYFPDWSSAMLREYGNLRDAELERIYKTANLVAKHEVENWPAIIGDRLRSS